MITPALPVRQAQDTVPYAAANWWCVVGAGRNAALAARIALSLQPDIRLVVWHHATLRVTRLGDHERNYTQSNGSPGGGISRAP